MYLFHRLLNLAVSYERNILKGVTNKNDIKAATMKIWFIPAMLNFPGNT